MTCLLIIEDDPGYCDLLKQRLGNLFCLRFASTLSQGIAELRREKPDVVLLDVGLPDSVSCDTLEKVKKSTDSPVVVVSGNDDLDFMHRSIKGNAAGYVVKGRDDEPRIMKREIENAVATHRAISRASSEIRGENP